MQEFISKLAKGIKPYEAGEQPKDREFIKLNTNENPYPPSPLVKMALEAVDTEKLGLYSDPNNELLVGAIARKYSLSRENIFVGNGSDEVLAFCFPAFFDNDGSGLAIANITYSFYPVYCQLFGIKAEIIPLKPDFKQDLVEYKKTKAQGIMLANPNAPTGIVTTKSEIEALLKAVKDKIVIVDEAYSDFSDESVVGLVPKYRNLLIVKTFSKSYSLAGARCGFALGDKKLIDALLRVKNSFNSYTVNYITERLAAAAIQDGEYYDKINGMVMKTRENFAKKLTTLGFNVLPSGANFVFATHKKETAENLYARLRERGILVRFFKKPLIDNFLRITIGTDEDMASVLTALGEILSR